MKRLIIAVLLLFIASPLLHAQQADDTVILVYKAKIHNYAHDQVQGTDYAEYIIKDWFAYHFIELNPTTREYIKEAVLVYYDGNQFQDYGCKYTEYVDSQKSTKSHVIGSASLVPDNSSKNSWGTANKGYAQLLVGTLKNSRGLKVGWSDKVPVATKLRGRLINYEDKKGKNAGEIWSNQISFLKFDKKATIQANKANQTLKEIFESTSEQLANEGYGKKLKYDEDK